MSWPFNHRLASQLISGQEGSGIYSTLLSFLVGTVRFTVEDSRTQGYESVKRWLVKWLLWGLSKQGQPQVLLWALSGISRLYNHQPGAYFSLLQDLSEKKDWFYRFVAAHEVHTVYAGLPDETLDLLQKLSADQEDTVRQGAAHSWSQLLKRDYSRVWVLVQEMASSEQYAIRHTAALAPVKYYQSPAVPQEQKKEIERFWKQYEADSRSGLRNLVRQMIVERVVEPGQKIPSESTS